MQAVEKTSDYRALLKGEFLRRNKSNPRYSLRRFAKQMGVSPATLSGVFRGSRRLSVKTAASIAEHLDLDPIASQQFLSTVAASHIPINSTNLFHIKNSKEATLDKVEMAQLAKDTYQIISDWHHYAILEMTHIARAKMTPTFIAKSLGCAYFEAVDALDRLKRVGLLEEKNGKWIEKSPMLTSGTDYPSGAMRKHHLQMLQKAKQSLLTDPIDKRDFTSITMAIDPSKIKIAKKLISDFRRKLCAILEDGKRERVYGLNIDLFPLMSEVKS